MDRETLFAIEEVSLFFSDFTLFWKSDCNFDVEFEAGVSIEAL